MTTSRQITIARTLPTELAGDTPINGFTITDNGDAGYTVTDGANGSENFTSGVAALRCYADFIDTFLDDQDDDTRAVHHGAMLDALADADAIEKCEATAA